jgi:transposase
MKSDLKYKAIKMRQGGMSYTQIKNVVNVSKGTLSVWLKDYPLSDERLKELRDNSPIRIEKYRNTRLKQREQVLENIFVNVSKK